MQVRRLIVLTLLVLPLLWGGMARAEVFANPGFYTVSVDGWTRVASPEGFRYRCTTCKGQVGVTIEYGPDAPWKTNDQFMASLATEKARKELADEWFGGQPTDKRAKAEVKRVGLGEIGGLRVLMVVTEVEMGSASAFGRFMIAVHKGRLLWCAVHYPLGVVDPDNEKAIDAFFAGLVFEK